MAKFSIFHQTIHPKEIMMTATEKASKGLHIGLWVVQVLLGLSFGFAGFMKMSAPVNELSVQMAWAGDIPGWLLRFIGASELAGGIGLIVPAITKIKVGLTVTAAWGLATVMLLAAVFHLIRAEYTDIVANLTLLALAIFVGWGRSKKALL